MDNRRPRISSYSPSSRSSTTRTPHRPQRPKKIVKSIWVKKGSTIGSQAVLPQTVKKSAMINPKQTWRPKGNYLDSVNRDNGSYTLKQFEYGNPEEDLKDYAIIDSGCSGSMTGDKDKFEIVMSKGSLMWSSTSVLFLQVLLPHIEQLKIQGTDPSQGKFKRLKRQTLSPRQQNRKAQRPNSSTCHSIYVQEEDTADFLEDIADKDVAVTPDLEEKVLD
ncbi:hypothetical protein Tco_1392235 [Tanacetum coccineum]